jgi:hypothetical protein
MSGEENSVPKAITSATQIDVAARLNAQSLDPEKAGEHCFPACNHVLGYKTPSRIQNPDGIQNLQWTTKPAVGYKIIGGI